MIEPRFTSHIPSYHPETAFSRPPGELIERESSGSEPRASTSEDLSSSELSSRSSPADATDRFPEEMVASSLTSSDPSLTPPTVPNTPLYRQLAAIVQRAITRNNRSQKISDERERAKFKKNYASFVDQLGEDRAQGMRLLGDKILSPAGKNVSKVDLMMNPDAYFSKSDRQVLKVLQSDLLQQIITGPRNQPLHENERWALEYLPCATIDETSRNSLIRIAADFKDVLTKNLPLHLLRLELNEADQILAGTSKDLFHSIQRDYKDPYYKSRWETAFDLEIFGPINDTSEIIKNNLADIASLFRKWDLAYIQKQAPPSSANKHDTTNQVKNEGRMRANIAVPKKSVQAKYQEEYRYLSSWGQNLKDIHDNSFKIASRAFGELATKSASPPAVR